MDYLAAGVDIGNRFGSPWGRLPTHTVGYFVGIVVQAAIVIAGVIMIFLFIFGGVSIIAGAGQQKPESVAKGKKALTSALIGFIIIFTAFWIVRLIETVLGIDIVTNPGI